ncbi:MAG: hypothetical protein ACOCXQ_03395 [Patescibacteria group bacterium]
MKLKKITVTQKSFFVTIVSKILNLLACSLVLFIFQLWGFTEVDGFGTALMFVIVTNSIDLLVTFLVDQPSGCLNLVVLASLGTTIGFIWLVPGISLPVDGLGSALKSGLFVVVYAYAVIFKLTLIAQSTKS